MSDFDGIAIGVRGVTGFIGVGIDDDGVVIAGENDFVGAGLDGSEPSESGNGHREDA